MGLGTALGKARYWGKGVANTAGDVVGKVTGAARTLGRKVSGFAGDLADSARRGYHGAIFDYMDSAKHGGEVWKQGPDRIAYINSRMARPAAAAPAAAIPSPVTSRKMINSSQLERGGRSAASGSMPKIGGFGTRSLVGAAVGGIYAQTQGEGFGGTLGRMGVGALIGGVGGGALRRMPGIRNLGGKGFGGGVTRIGEGIQRGVSRLTTGKMARLPNQAYAAMGLGAAGFIGGGMVGHPFLGAAAGVGVGYGFGGGGGGSAIQRSAKRSSNAPLRKVRGGGLKKHVRAANQQRHASPAVQLFM